MSRQRNLASVVDYCALYISTDVWVPMMKRKINIPAGVQVEIDGRKIKITGSNGKIQREFPQMVDVRIEGKEIVLRSGDRRKDKAVLGAWAAHVQNMIRGVTRGFGCKLRVVYRHFPMSLQVRGDRVMISNFLGERKPRQARILPGVKVDISGQDVLVTGADKEAVGQTAANLEQATRLSKRDRRKFEDGIFIIEKGIEIA